MSISILSFLHSPPECDSYDDTKSLERDLCHKLSNVSNINTIAIMPFKSFTDANKSDAGCDQPPHGHDDIHDETHSSLPPCSSSSSSSKTTWTTNRGGSFCYASMSAPSRHYSSPSSSLAASLQSPSISSPSVTGCMYKNSAPMPASMTPPPLASTSPCHESRGSIHRNINHSQSNHNNNTLNLGPSSDKTTTTSTRRAPDFTDIENHCICRAWVSVSEDPIRSTDQKRVNFWRNIHKAYTALIDDTNDKTKSSLTKFHIDCFKRLNRREPTLEEIESMDINPMVYSHRNHTSIQQKFSKCIQPEVNHFIAIYKMLLYHVYLPFVLL